MSYVVQQRDIDIICQKHRDVEFKIELLNNNMKIIDVIEGFLLNYNISIDAESDIRRTFNCDLHVKNSTFLIGNDKRIWIDKYIKPYIGIRYLKTGEIIWYLLGTYAFNETNYNYSVESRTLSLSCSDLMCTLNGDKGGIIEGLNNMIPEGTSVRNAIIGILKDANVIKYHVEEINKEIPYDLDFSVGATYYRMLREILDLYAGYEMFFDINGTFVIKLIPTTKNEVSVLDEYIMNSVIISEPQLKNTFNNIYNVTQVWGKIIETDYYTTNVTSSNGTVYNANIDGITELEGFSKYGIRIPVLSKYGTKLNINNLGAKNIVEDEKTPISDMKLLPNTDYVFKYRKATDDFLFLGQYQAYGEYKCYETDNPFSITNLGYEIKQVLQFDELYSDSLCQQRAKYETWVSTRFQDSITLNILSIPFLDVNWKISYIPNMTGEKTDYIIKSISGSFDEYSITLIKYSELYPDII